MFVVRVNRWRFEVFTLPPGRMWWKPYWHSLANMMYWLRDGEKPRGFAFGACRVGVSLERMPEDEWED